MLRNIFAALVVLTMLPAWGESAEPPEEFEISGQVIDLHTGKPVPDIEIVLGFAMTTDRVTGDGAGQTRADAEGRFSFHFYKPGKETLLEFGVDVKDPVLVSAGRHPG